MQYTFECATVATETDYQWKLRDAPSVHFYRVSATEWRVTAQRSRYEEQLIAEGFPIDQPVTIGLRACAQAIAEILDCEPTLARGVQDDYIRNDDGIRTYRATYRVGNTGFFIGKEVIRQSYANEREVWSIVPIPLQVRPNTHYLPIVVYNRLRSDTWQTRRAALEALETTFREEISLRQQGHWYQLSRYTQQLRHRIQQRIKQD